MNLKDNVNDVVLVLGNCNRIGANIDAQQKAIDRKPLSIYDTTLLIDIKYILIGIQEFLNDPINGKIKTWDC